MEKQLVTIGEILFDYIDNTPFLGGAPLNVAAFASQLEEKADLNVGIISTIGNDFLGGRAYQKMLEMEIDLRGITVAPNLKTGTVTVHRGEQGESYTIFPDVAYDRLACTEREITLTTHADAVVFGSLIVRTDHNRRALERLLDTPDRTMRICDINLRTDCYTADSIGWCLRRAEVLKLNNHEVERFRCMGITKNADPVEFIKEICSDSRFSIHACVVTLGAEGLVVGTRQHTTRCNAIAVPASAIRDTVGCGDAVTAALAARLLLGDSLFEAAARANRAGAFAATKPGGIYRFSREEFDGFLPHPIQFTEPIRRERGLDA